MSAEPNRKKAYQPDLRWRIVYQRAALHHSFCHIATSLNIAASTVHRTFSSFDKSGSVAPSRISRKHLWKLSESSELFVVGVILNNPTMYLGEVCREINDVLVYRFQLFANCLKSMDLHEKKPHKLQSREMIPLEEPF